VADKRHTAAALPQFKMASNPLHSRLCGFHDGGTDKIPFLIVLNIIESKVLISYCYFKSLKLATFQKELPAALTTTTTSTIIIIILMNQ
jgi:hypothetical protein